MVHHGIAEIMLNLALNTNQSIYGMYWKIRCHSSSDTLQLLLLLSIKGRQIMHVFQEGHIHYKETSKQQKCPDV